MGLYDDQDQNQNKKQNKLLRDDGLLWEKSWERNLLSNETTPFHYNSKNFTYVLDEDLLDLMNLGCLSTCIYKKYFKNMDNV